MDQLIEMLIQVIIDLFRGSGAKPTQAPPQRPPPRPAGKQQAPQRRPPPPITPRPAPRPVQPQAARPAARQVARPQQPAPVQRAAPVQQPAAVQTAAPSVKHPSVAVDAAALRRWLKPKVLRDQFILSEIFQPPIALRETYRWAGYNQSMSLELASAIKGKAKSLGFDRTGITSAEPSRYQDYFRKWLDDGRAGTMTYLDARFAERTDPAAYLPGAKSVVCVAMNYFVPLNSAPHPNPPPEYQERERNDGRVARYALGDDYHGIIKPRLHALADWLREQGPAAQFRCAVDTAPVMEKELAARAGVGWMGKNTCIINEEIGSWLFLGEVLTTLELPPDEPATDRCGTCTECLDACPTQAITSPYQLDATKCISYLTIEHSGEMPPDMREKLSGWLYGCDICQDVCPFNRRAAATWNRDFNRGLHPVRLI